METTTTEAAGETTGRSAALTPRSGEAGGGVVAVDVGM